MVLGYGIGTILYIGVLADRIHGRSHACFVFMILNISSLIWMSSMYSIISGLVAALFDSW